MTQEGSFDARLSPEQAEGIYDVLVAHVGARDHEDDRYPFVYAQTNGYVSEYRFMGSLGFGGKFWRTRFADGTERWRVDCYREDEDDHRRQQIEIANEALRLLQEGQA